MAASTASSDGSVPKRRATPVKNSLRFDLGKRAAAAVMRRNCLSEKVG
jgi:hypothetical protein